MTEENNLEKMLKKSIRWLTLASVCFVVSGCSAPKIKSLSDSETAQPQIESTSQLIIKENRFVPDKITIEVGSTVTFTNADTTSHIIASDPHPEHNQLPDLYSSPIYKNGSYSYTFQKAGSFGVHLEENPSIKAQIVVLSSGGETQ